MSGLILAAIYGTLVGGTLVAPPSPVVTERGWQCAETITERQANALGFALVVDVPPTCGADEYAVATGYETRDGRIYRTYEVRKSAPHVRRYSKLKLITAAKACGKWDTVKAFVRQAGLEDEWLACQYFEDGNALFVGGTNAVVTSGIATDAEVRALLEAARDE